MPRQQRERLRRLFKEGAYVAFGLGCLHGSAHGVGGSAGAALLLFGAGQQDEATNLDARVSRFGGAEPGEDPVWPARVKVEAGQRFRREVPGWGRVHHEQGAFQVTELEAAVDFHLTQLLAQGIGEQTRVADSAKACEPMQGLAGPLLGDQDADQVLSRRPTSRGWLHANRTPGGQPRVAPERPQGRCVRSSPRRGPVGPRCRRAPPGCPGHSWRARWWRVASPRATGPGDRPASRRVPGWLAAACSRVP